MACAICKGAGKYKNSLGIEVTCKCTYEDIKTPIMPIMTKLSKGDNESAVYNGMIPEGRISDNFDFNKLRDRVESQYAGEYHIDHFEDYVNLLNQILATIDSGEMLTGSYIIGAPNGFSKTTFANTCIKMMYKQGRKTAPYASLVEIFEVYKKYDNRVKLVERMDTDLDDRELSPVYPIDRSFLPEYLTKHGMKVYLDADILFTNLTRVEYRERELAMIALLTEARAKQGKSTIIFIDVSLKYYTGINGDKLRFWDEWIDHTNGKYSSPGKYTYLSCFKKPKNYRR